MPCSSWNSADDSLTLPPKSSVISTLLSSKTLTVGQQPCTPHRVCTSLGFKASASELSFFGLFMSEACLLITRSSMDWPGQANPRPQYMTKNTLCQAVKFKRPHHYGGVLISNFMYILSLSKRIKG